MQSVKPILDTNVLRHFSFAYPTGLEILFSGLESSKAYLPPEVYNQDEGELPLAERNDEDLSELARGIRSAERLAEEKPAEEAKRYKSWLANAQQLPRNFKRGRLIIEPLTLDELRKRLKLEGAFGIGKGEAACLVLAMRENGIAVFTSTDKAATNAAIVLGVRFFTGINVLQNWIKNAKPTKTEVNTVLDGLADARYKLDIKTHNQLLDLAR